MIQTGGREKGIEHRFIVFFFERFTFDHRRYSEAVWVYGININLEFSIAPAKGDPSTTFVERLDKAAIYEAGD